PRPDPAVRQHHGRLPRPGADRRGRAAHARAGLRPGEGRRVLHRPGGHPHRPRAADHRVPLDADHRHRGRPALRRPGPAAHRPPVHPGGTMREFKLYIGGEFVDAASGKTFDTHSPSTGEAIATVALGDKEDIDRAIGAARTAFDEGPWPNMAPAERTAAMMR